LKVSNYAKVSNFEGEGVSSYTLEQWQKRLRQQFSRLKVSNYAEVSTFGGEGVSNYADVSTFGGEGYENTLRSAIFKVKSIKLH
jgi:hypothetical protein